MRNGGKGWVQSGLFCARKMPAMANTAANAPASMTRLYLMPHAQDDWYYQQLYQPIAGVDGGRLHRDILPDDGSSEQDYREPDPQKNPEVRRDEPIGDAEQCDEVCDDVGEDDAPDQLDDQLPRRHLCAGHRRRRVHAARAHPRLVEKQRTVPEPAEHEDRDGGYKDRDVVHVDHLS